MRLLFTLQSYCILGNKIKSINHSLDRIKIDVALLGLRGESVNSIPQTGLDRETDSFIDDSKVVRSEERRVGKECVP